MPNPEISVRVTTRAGIKLLTSANRTDRFKPIALYAPVGLVTRMSLPDGQVHSNPRHSSKLEISRFKSVRGGTTLTVPSDKALRLVEAFRQLKPNHPTDCHSFMAAVSGWELDRDQALVYSGEYVQPGEELEPGAPYTVVSELSGVEACTHSAIATDDGRLLGVLGWGSALTILSLEATKELYSGGGEAHLARLVNPNPGA